MAVPELASWDLPSGSLSARRSGTGSTPVLMIHGLGGSSLNWVPLMTELDAEVDALALDLPGFGASSPPRDGNYRPSGHARAVAALAERWIVERSRTTARPGPVHVVGNSLGGVVAVAFAAARPDLVASVTLISPAMPSVSIGRGNVHLPVVALPGVGEGLLRRYGQASAEGRLQATLDACFADPARVSPELREELVAEVRRRDELPYVGDAFLSSLRGMLGSFLDPGPRAPWRAARSLPGPTLVIYGEDDVLVSARAARRAARRFQRSRVVVMPDCGHAAQMEHPAHVAQLWRELVRGTT